jgi:hypothetical protein
MYQCRKQETIYERWRELKTEKKPRYVKTQNRIRGVESIYELALIFPNHKRASKTYIRDKIGRTIEAKLEDDKFRIKEIIPYWREELIYDYQKKVRIRYHELFNQILDIAELGQIFTLNNKLFVQNDDNILLFGNKNLKDSERLFNLIKEDVLKKKKGNFIFIKDISTAQRKTLYSLLESKGFKRTELFRHYSY